MVCGGSVLVMRMRLDADGDPDEEDLLLLIHGCSSPKSITGILLPELPRSDLA